MNHGNDGEDDYIKECSCLSSKIESEEQSDSSSEESNVFLVRETGQRRWMIPDNELEIVARVSPDHGMWTHSEYQYYFSDFYLK